MPSQYTEDTGDRVTYTYDTTPTGVSYPGLLTTATFATSLGTNNWTLENLHTYTPMDQVATKTLSVVSEQTSGTSPSGSLTVSYGYDGLGTLTSIQYPSSTTFTYTLDSLERPTALTDSTNYTWATGAAYNAANQITAATFPSGTQAWLYNTLNQLIQRTTTSGATTRMNMTYSYTAGKNNGQIASSADAVTGETVAYQYDSLKRLVGATSSPLPPVNGTAWSEAYAYDGFGNLTGMAPTGSGSAPALSVSVNPATNQISPANIAYDGNGNVTQFGPSGSVTNMTYDVSNRPVTVNSVDAYAYDPTNQRVYFRNSAGTETLYVYGVDGKKLATYTVGVTSGQVSFTLQSQNVYFAGNLLSAEGNAVAADGPSSVRWNAGASHTYYPFGAEYNPTPNNTEKYATYTRDNLTGLDYAMNRYYYSAWGRFMSPDPYNGSAHLGDPQSWNRYTYATNDPINRRDPSGKDDGDPYGGDGEDGCPDGEICIWGGYPPPEPCLADFCATGIGSLPTDPDPTPDPTTPPPDPTDPQDPQPPPPTPTPTPTPPAACEVAVGYVPAIPHLPGFHTFLYLDDDTTGWQVADAGPAQYPHIVVTGSGGIGFSGGFGNLITAVSPTGLYGESTNPNVKYYWEAPESCQLVDELEMDANNLNNIVPYTGLWFGSNWYNSNSFTYTLIQDFALPAGAPPVWAPGWGNYIPH